ncbi:MAG: hypothetical protein GY943_29405, partial [Chloroflexi bacterium]|nr:hypothetical protein [Chloroflexota bacterium]
LNMQRSLINDNINYGVTNNYPASVDLRFSWWGAANGPSGDGSGSGDALFGDVLYTPWLEEAGCEADAVYLLYVPMVIRP